MNQPHENIVKFRCQYPGCESKVFHQIDSRGIFRNVNGNVIWDLTAQIAIVYFPACAYHALDWDVANIQNCAAQ